MHDRTRLGRILRASLTDDPGLGALVEDADLAGLAELAFEHGVAAQVYASLRPLEVADTVALRMLAGANLETRAHTGRVLADLEYLATLLESVAVPGSSSKASPSRPRSTTRPTFGPREISTCSSRPPTSHGWSTPSPRPTTRSTTRTGC